MEEKMERKRIERSRKMIADPNTWPRWPVLPLMRINHSLGPTDGGFLTEAKTPPYKVWIGYIYNLPEKLKNFELYDTVEALLAEWRID